MDKKHLKTYKELRGLVWAIFIWIIVFIVFIVFATLLIFGASGYAYNFRTREIQKTGLIYLKSSPTSAKIFLDEKLITSQTPTRISYLLPGRYQLKIQKSGYKTLEKNLQVYEGLVTKFDNLLLFFQNPRISSIKIKNISNFIPLNTQELILIYKKDNDLRVGTFNYKDNLLQQSVKIQNFPETEFNIELLHEDYLILKTPDHQNWLLNWKTGNALNLNQTLKLVKIDKILARDNKFFILVEGNLHFYNFSNQENQLIFTNILDFEINSDVFALEKVDQKTNLIQIDPDNLRKRILAEKLKINDPKQIFVSSDTQIAILNNSGKLYIFSEKKLTKLTDEVIGVTWVKNKTWLNFQEQDLLVYFTEHEIWLYQKDHKNVLNELEEKYLLRRQGAAIDAVDYFYNENNFYYFSNQEIGVSDAWGTATEILALPDLAKFKFSQDFKDLFVLDQNQLQIYKIR